MTLTHLKKQLDGFIQEFGDAEFNLVLSSGDEDNAQQLYVVLSSSIDRVPASTGKQALITVEVGE